MRNLNRAKMLATSVIFTKQSKVNNHPLGENSPNLVTLPESNWPNCHPQIVEKK
jgi:hypothetical protein